MTLVPAGHVQILAEDRDLLARIPAEERRAATEAVVARVGQYTPGTLQLGSAPHPATLGVLVLEGVLFRHSRAGRFSMVEVLGPGDLVRPWDWLPAGETVSMTTLWEAMTPGRLAVLDRRVAVSLARWPEITSALLEREVRRMRSMAFNLMAVQAPRVRERIVLVLWHLADRWGHVTPDGVVLELPGLTHSVLAELVASRRPSVTTSLVQLQADGDVLREGAGRYLLRGRRPDALAELSEVLALHGSGVMHAAT